ncbi:hypothetical protein BM74_06810 [Bacillus thuringiensis]|uniref:XRE family transcriptional regulator n=1 Tax=Bacillus thuringiensis TaxID=1428 RepID=A0A437SNT6_BACTU|nr:MULTISPECIES: hypothetical protein [Bacillus]EJR47514.1 hypothetical protein IIK_03513 [Bacillus cereus VD102]MCP1166771.1 hypothetical protein [Bacillus sp. 1813sda1]PEF45296.1 hypothetical protein CON22_17460 [Bacillus cereus]RVU64933.1 hypothetical protein BM74_06810 [Bacillus thuringiensis]
MRLSHEEKEIKICLNEATRDRYKKYKQLTGCSNTAFANKIGFSRCTFQNWLANKFDFSVGACEHMQFIMGCIHDELATIK